MKKLCILFGNCQLNAIETMLNYSTFYDTYYVVKYANWQLLKSSTMTIPILQLQNADLIIYQPLSDIHGCYSTNKNNPDSFFRLLKDTCKVISFPRIHNNAIFPIFHKNKTRIIYGTVKNQIQSLEELYSLYDNNKIDYDFDERMKLNYKLSKEREENTDVKIIDYIMNNIKKYKLFLTQDHPTKYVFNEVVRQICCILQIPYDTEKYLDAVENIIGAEDSMYHREDCQYPLSRYAIRHFGFEYSTTEHPDANEFYRNITAEYWLNFKSQQ